MFQNRREDEKINSFQYKGKLEESRNKIASF